MYDLVIYFLFASKILIINSKFNIYKVVFIKKYWDDDIFDRSDLIQANLSNLKLRSWI
jgi:hypothetical protein